MRSASAAAAIRSLVAFAALVIIGCGDETPRDQASDAGPSATVVASTAAPIPRPPDLIAPSGAATAHAPPGSYCWDIACADALAEVTTAEVLRVARGDVIRMTTPDGAPRISEVQVLGVIPRSAPVESREDGLLAWVPAPGSQTAVPFTLDDGVITATADLPPGEFVLSIFALYADPKGDASYAFQLDVR